MRKEIQELQRSVEEVRHAVVPGAEHAPPPATEEEDL